MTKMKVVWSIAAASLLALAGHARAIDFAVDPRGTFLLLSSDANAQAPLILSLDSLGVSAGDTLNLTSTGAYIPGGSVPTDTEWRLVGVFSTTSTLLAPNIRDRVPGAIDAGNNFTTPVTFNGGLATDIAQDFAFTGIAISVGVPTGANFLFVGTSDRFYGDNADPNLDFGVRITTSPVVPAIPEPSTYLLMLAGLAAVVFGKRKHDQRRICSTI